MADILYYYPYVPFELILRQICPLRPKKCHLPPKTWFSLSGGRRWCSRAFFHVITFLIFLICKYTYKLVHTCNRWASLPVQCKEAEEEELNVDKTKETNAQQERNEQGAGCVANRGEFTCFVLVSAMLVTCIHHPLALGSTQSDRNEQL